MITHPSGMSPSVQLHRKSGREWPAQDPGALPTLLWLSAGWRRSARSRGARTPLNEIQIVEFSKPWRASDKMLQIIQYLGCH
jgi:hypothetical protein